MLTMRPLRRARISSTARRVARMVASSETSMTKRHVASSEAWNSLARSRADWPTLWKRASRRPKRRREGGQPAGPAAGGLADFVEQDVDAAEAPADGRKGLGHRALIGPVRGDRQHLP